MGHPATELILPHRILANLTVWSRRANIGVDLGILKHAQRRGSHVAADGMCGVAVSVQKCVQLAGALEHIKHLRCGQSDGHWEGSTCTSIPINLSTMMQSAKQDTGS